MLTGSEMRRRGTWELDRDPYLLETSVPGIFACGDVRFGPVKRVAAAVGEGSMAIAFVHQYLKDADAADANPTSAPVAAVSGTRETCRHRSDERESGLERRERIRLALPSRSDRASLRASRARVHGTWTRCIFHAR